MTSPYRLQPLSWHTRCAFCYGNGSVRLYYSNARGERFASAIGVECPFCEGKGVTSFGSKSFADLVEVSLDTGNGFSSCGQVPRAKSVAYAQACKVATNAQAWRIDDIDGIGKVVVSWP